MLKKRKIKISFYYTIKQKCNVRELYKKNIMGELALETKPKQRRLYIE